MHKTVKKKASGWDKWKNKKTPGSVAEPDIRIRWTPAHTDVGATGPTGAFDYSAKDLRAPDAGPGKKFDGGKSRWDLLPWKVLDALEEYAAEEQPSATWVSTMVTIVNYRTEPNTRNALAVLWDVVNQLREQLDLESGDEEWSYGRMCAYDAIAEILAFGANKYGANNWQNVTDAKGRYFSALVRQRVAIQDGEAIDPESGKLHLAHAGCNAFFLAALEIGFDPVLT